MSLGSVISLGSVKTPLFMRTCIAYVVTTLLALAHCCFAADIKTRDGHVYHDVDIRGIDEAGLHIVHREGITTLLWIGLPSSLQEQYHYDAAKGRRNPKVAAREAYEACQREGSTTGQLEAQALARKAQEFAALRQVEAERQAEIQRQRALAARAREEAEAQREARERARTSNSLSVNLIQEDGVQKIPLQINGTITLKFTVDSGASDVVIPKDVFLTLIRAGTIKGGDFLPGKTYELADGSTVKSDRFVIRSLIIGGVTITDVEACIGGLKAQLLLGQSFLSKFKEWKIDNTKSQILLTR